MRLDGVFLKGHFDTVIALCEQLCHAPLPIPSSVLDRLTEVLGEIKPSEAYEDHFRKTQLGMNEFLLSSASDAIFNAYPVMKRPEQIEWLQRHLNKQAELQSLCGIKIDPPVIEPVSWGEKGDVARIGFHPDYDGPEHFNVFLNVDYAPTWISPENAVESITHEGWHHFNNHLGRELKFGRLDINHPLYAEALYFMTQWSRNAFVKVTPSYENQLDERLARAFGQAMAHEMQKIHRAFTSSSPTMFSSHELHAI